LASVCSNLCENTAPLLGISPLKPDNSAMDIKPTSPDQGFQFPGTFEISAMGSSEVLVEIVMIQVLQDLGLTVFPDTVRQRPSAKGNYVSITISFEAHSREDYDAAHGALRAHPAVKWTL
jgi:uncharacterized protein